MSSTAESLASKRKEDLLNMFSDVGHRQSPSLRKQSLIDKVLQLQADVAAGTETLDVLDLMEEEGEEVIERLQSVFRTNVYETSLNAWVMKPLISTPGMKEGSINEAQVLQALPQFCSEHKACCASIFENGYFRDGHNAQYQYTVKYIRSTGLIGSRTVELLADSPDGLVTLTVEHGVSFDAAVEIKTMTSPRIIISARERRDKYEMFNLIQDIGRNAHLCRLFQDLITTPEYRLQCIHHAATLGLDHVLFVVAKGSNCGVGEIIYATMLKFSHLLRAQYTFCITSIRQGAFDWIGKGADHIPGEYDELIKSSHASELHSFASFYSLSRVYKRLTLSAGPLPPARMIRPSSLVYWNHLKGGVDEFSRALQSLAYTNSSENPIVNVIGQLLCSQVNNAAVLHRLSLATEKGILPDWTVYKNNEDDVGYNSLRHSVSTCCSFAAFARMLAKEFRDKYGGAFLSPKHLSAHSTRRSKNKKVIQLYTRHVVSKYNRPEDRKRRLSNLPSHLPVKDIDAFCSLCGYSYRLNYQGEKFQLFRGYREKIWCSVCRQAICSGCWDTWHGDEVLVRAQVTEEEIEELKRHAEEEIDKRQTIREENVDTEVPDRS